MKIYRIDDTRRQRFEPTLADAKLTATNGYKVIDEDGKSYECRFNKDDVLIELIEVPSDLRSIVDILNNVNEFSKPLRTWGPGARYGFVEYVNGEPKRKPKEPANTCEGYAPPPKPPTSAAEMFVEQAKAAP